jgi:signal transduction histidine kinase
VTPEAASARSSARPAPNGSGRWRVAEPVPADQPSRTIAGIDVGAWSATHPFVVDLAIASVVAVVPLVVEATDARGLGATLDAIDVASSAVAFALILLRRRAPFAVLVAAVTAAIWSQVPADDQIVLQVAAFLALYTVASTSSRTIAWTAGTVAAAALFLTATITTPGPWHDGENLEQIAWMVVATAVGDAVRSRRAYVTAMQERAAALQERAERAEEALEEEARRQVVEERLRIARELHDVVAHHIAVINVQAGVATHLMRDDPTGAEEALAHVRRGVSRVLDEISDILSVLRQSDDPTTSTDPLPTLDQLDRLIASFTSVGLEVEWHTAGARQPVAPAVELAAYRIVQESLTNAHRHGRGPRACLRVAYAPHMLSVEVLNDADPDRRTGGRPGHGIIGMRERVAAAGGTIDVGTTTDGRFRVHATLPVSGEDR